jgi:hypothetical protein
MAVGSDDDETGAPTFGFLDGHFLGRAFEALGGDDEVGRLFADLYRIRGGWIVPDSL